MKIYGYMNFFQYLTLNLNPSGVKSLHTYPPWAAWPYMYVPLSSDSSLHKLNLGLSGVLHRHFFHRRHRKVFKI